MEGMGGREGESTFNILHVAEKEITVHFKPSYSLGGSLLCCLESWPLWGVTTFRRGYKAAACGPP